ncbi:MAG: 50S ribosomal protein L11 methyltransferase [Bacteroides sp.]|nr:50S ribosomal protein L11 methyltransferase [Bacteroides sp.]
MNDYVEVRYNLEPCDETMTDVLAALLAEEGFESFVPDDNGLTAYVKSELYTPEINRRVVEAFPFDSVITADATTIEGQDWNAEWEKHYFRPIVVDDKCVIHSSFHTDIPECPYDIVIDPKMAFGTGHHSTTSLILRQLLSLDLKGRKVVDVGTGTGILAILAAMRGATDVTGIEIDPFAFENAVENVRTNGHPEITMKLGDASCLEGITDADLLLANINRNVITADLPAYVRAVRMGGTVILSGFYIEDVEVVRPVAESLGLALCEVTEDNRWACMKLEKNSDEASH